MERGENPFSWLKKRISSRIDRALPPPISEPPKELSRQGQEIWARTADIAVSHAKPYRGLIYHPSEASLLTSFLQEDNLENLKEIRSSPFRQEVKDHFQKERSQILNSFVLENNLDALDANEDELGKRLKIWEFSIKNLAEILSKVQVSDDEVDKQIEMINQSRKRILSLKTKTPSGLPSPVEE